MGNTIIHFSENKQEEADVFLLTETYTYCRTPLNPSTQGQIFVFLRFLLRGKAGSLV